MARWLNKNVFAFGLTSLLGDICHEMATAVLPQFMQAIGSSAAALGAIEGIADALSSFVKLGVGFHSDRTGHRKAWTTFGYVLTAIAKAVFAFAFAWPLILVGRVVGWLGRGIRGPVRDAMLADSITPENRGKAFGFHRAGDTVGAVIGPLAAFGLLTFIERHPQIINTLWQCFPNLTDAAGSQFRIVFLLTLIPGILSVLSIWLLVKDERHTPNHAMQFWATVRMLPKDYRAFLIAVGVFGIADFAPTLMILRATTVLEPKMGLLQSSQIAALLYTLRNIVYSAASFPIGALSDRFNRTGYLAVGYGVAVITFAMFVFVLPSVWWFALCFALAGVFIAWEDTIEGVAVRDYVSSDIAGTAFGVLATVNGIGDFISSVVVGLLWTLISPQLAFGYAAIIGAVGTILMAGIKHRQE